MWHTCGLHRNCTRIQSDSKLAVCASCYAFTFCITCICLPMQWNETIKLFRGGMPLRRHWANFRCYDNSFTGSEAVDYLHELLRHNYNFGPEVTRYQTLQLLRKFLKAHVIEDFKGRHGTEDFEDNGHLYRYAFVFLYPVIHVR